VYDSDTEIYSDVSITTSTAYPSCGNEYTVQRPGINNAARLILFDSPFSNDMSDACSLALFFKPPYFTNNGGEVDLSIIMGPSSGSREQECKDANCDNVAGLRGFISGSVNSDMDSDGDGVPDDMDDCPDSDLSETVIIDEIDTRVENFLFDTGCTISDLIEDLADEALTHGDFVSGIAAFTNSLKKMGEITGKEKGVIQSAAAQADIP